MKSLTKLVDSSIYLFLMPVGVLYVFPTFFRNLELRFFTLPQNSFLNVIGTGLMWFGAAIAISCAVIMFINKYGSVVPFYTPTKIVKSGPYGLVRHPMMWALFFVLFGEVLVYSSPFTLLWLLIWIRFSTILISEYEEPYLVRTFGEDYVAYCRQVPRWIPRLKKA
jgi:protein-S-isoprenylcysteine O-methyltransferase Ste14